MNKTQFKEKLIYKIEEEFIHGINDKAFVKLLKEYKELMKGYEDTLDGEEKEKYKKMMILVDRLLEKGRKNFEYTEEVDILINTLFKIYKLRKRKIKNEGD